MERPQSDEEIRVVVEALQQIDPLLAVRWEPNAVLVRPGSYSVLGQRVDPVYEGRWEVIRYDTDNLHTNRRHEGRVYARLCRVTALSREGRVPVMLADGPYAPLGPWLVEYMRLWDRAQSHWMNAMDALWREHDAIEHSGDAELHAAQQQAAEKVFRTAGGETWMGRGMGDATAPARVPRPQPSPQETPV